MRKLIPLLLLWLLSSLVMAKPVRDGHVQVELLGQSSAIVPGKTLWLGVRFQLDPGWHVYWKFPGASGFPPSFKWKLPPGLKEPAISWPVPEREVISGLTQFVYPKEVLLLTPVEVPADFKASAPVEFKVDANWLACEKSCVPGKASLALSLPVAASASDGPQAGLFAETKKHLPESAGNIQLRAWKLKPKLAFLEYSGKAGDKLDFFPEVEDPNLDSAPVWKAGSGVEIPVGEKDKNLKGLLLIENGQDHQAVEIDVPLAASAPAPKTGGASSSEAPASDVTLFGALWTAFVGGMILNLMPCVFPVLSLKALSLVKHSDEKAPAWASGLVYTTGVLLSVWAIALPILLLRGGTSSLGWGYQMQSPLFVFILAALFLGIALNLFGLFEVGERLTQLGSLAENKKGLSESFWSGVVATVAATPCTAPFMAGAIGYAVTQTTALAMVIFTLLGLGMAFPYVVLCVVPATRTWLPRPGAWMESFKQFLGFPMLGAMVWFLSILSTELNQNGFMLAMGCLVAIAMGAWMYGRWGYSGKPAVALRAKVAAAIFILVPLAWGGYSVGLPVFEPQSTGGTTTEANGLTWESFSPQKLAEYRAQGKPVFIDFTASWCVNCKVNEAGSLHNQGVVAAFRQKGIITMKADWTRRDETISKALAEFGRTGVPFYVLYPGSGQPITFPEVLTPTIVLENLARV